jgi:hypothetical protein
VWCRGDAFSAARGLYGAAKDEAVPQEVEAKSLAPRAASNLCV